MGISMESLASTSFVDLIASCAKSAEINPQDVVLELTQSRSMLNSPTPMENLTRLSLKRFRLSIDDFAANNSSLIQLRSFPLTEIKVSMGFAGSVEHDDTALAMYEVTLAAARELDLDVVAASVDDLSAWKLTRQAGCAMAQGEFISGPMAAELIPTWISSWRHRIDGFMASGSS
jgi:EAL domain-containing protein (putative c-di-GMP-specific phosphodiesterase class I)